MRKKFVYAPEYHAWRNMRQRCRNPKVRNYSSYGGRGISVCARWLYDYKAFLADMGRRPSSTHSLDRIDNDGNYEPGNCRWATREEQTRNTRQNAFVIVAGKKMCLMDAARQRGLSLSTAYHRIMDHGMTPQEALDTPVDKRNRKYQHLITAFGRTRSLTEWADEAGIARSSLKQRLDRGMPAEEAVSKPRRRQSNYGSRR